MRKSISFYIFLSLLNGTGQGTEVQDFGTQTGLDTQPSQNFSPKLPREIVQVSNMLLQKREALGDSVTKKPGDEASQTQDSREKPGNPLQELNDGVRQVPPTEVPKIQTSEFGASKSVQTPKYPQTASKYFLDSKGDKLRLNLHNEFDGSHWTTKIRIDTQWSAKEISMEKIEKFLKAQTPLKITQTRSEWIADLIKTNRYFNLELSTASEAENPPFEDLAQLPAPNHSDFMISTQNNGPRILIKVSYPKLRRIKCLVFGNISRTGKPSDFYKYSPGFMSLDIVGHVSLKPEDQQPDPNGAGSQFDRKRYQRDISFEFLTDLPYSRNGDTWRSLYEKYGVEGQALCQALDLGLKPHMFFQIQNIVSKRFGCGDIAFDQQEVTSFVNYFQTLKDSEDCEKIFAEDFVLPKLQFYWPEERKISLI